MKFCTAPGVVSKVRMKIRAFGCHCAYNVEGDITQKTLNKWIVLTVDCDFSNLR